EILEEILLHLDPTTLLLSQRVSTNWHTLIQDSPRCQTALFFKPSSPGSPRILNPFITSPLWPHLLRDRRPPPPTPKRYSQMKPERTHIFMRPEASWREMLIQQPPALCVGIVETHFENRMAVRLTETVFQPGGEVIRLKHVEGAVEDGILVPAKDGPAFWTGGSFRDEE
ncbi:hypothetical protein BO78DRAFT_269313, partial [Aspergillus sclerotiicarbonarius CBS 121057]